MKKKKTLFLGLSLVGFVVGMGILSFFWLPHDPNQMNTALRFEPSSLTYWFGTDQFGRDILSRVMYATRFALLVGVGSVSVGATVGIVTGSVAAMANSKIRGVILRVIDGFMAFPGILLAMMLVAVLGKGVINAVFAIGIFMIPTFARLVCTLMLEGKNLLYIKAARSYGCNTWQLVVHYLLPAMLPRLVTQFSCSIAGAILVEASLSFLGLGVQPPDASWGLMLSEARQFVLTYPNLVVAPGLILLITGLGFNLVGDALNDSLLSRDCI